MKLILFLCFNTLVSTCFTQFKIDANSRFGLGTLYPNSAYRCHIAGNLLCTSYPANPSYELRFKVGNGWPGCEIGASSDILSFWTPEYGYNSLRASDYIKVSDSTLKFEVEPIKSIMSKIILMTPLKYKMEDDKIDGETGKRIKKTKVEFGFFSQEISRLFPEINLTTKDQNGLILLDYDQIIPIAIEGIKEQQKHIDSLEMKIEQLSLLVNILLSKQNTDQSNQNKLFPCIPNPTSDETAISYLIDNNFFQNAEIIIFNSIGQVQLKHQINHSGSGIINVDKKQIGSGTFYYSFFVNGNFIDSKSLVFN